MAILRVLADYPLKVEVGRNFSLNPVRLAHCNVDVPIILDDNKPESNRGRGDRYNEHSRGISTSQGPSLVPDRSDPSKHHRWLKRAMSATLVRKRALDDACPNANAHRPHGACNHHAVEWIDVGC